MAAVPVRVDAPGGAVLPTRRALLFRGGEGLLLLLRGATPDVHGRVSSDHVLAAMLVVRILIPRRE